MHILNSMPENTIDEKINKILEFVKVKTEWHVSTVRKATQHLPVSEIDQLLSRWKTDAVKNPVKVISSDVLTNNIFINNERDQWVVFDKNINFKEVMDYDSKFVDLYDIEYKKALEDDFNNWFKHYEKDIIIEYIERHFESSSLWDIHRDRTIKPNGVVIESPELLLIEAIIFLNKIFSMIKEPLFTNGTTSLHVYFKYDENEIDLLNLIVSLGNLSLIKILSKVKDINGENLIQSFSKMIETSSGKKIKNNILIMNKKIGECLNDTRIINIKNGYIKFYDIVSGDKYEKRIDEVERIIRKYSRSIYVASLPLVDKKEYLKHLVSVFGTKKTIIDFLNTDIFSFFKK